MTLVRTIRNFNRVMLVVASVAGLGWALLETRFARPSGVLSVLAGLLIGIGAEVLERLRAAPRRVTGRRAFIRAVRAIPKESPIGVTASAADQEARAFAEQLVNLLSEAGWDVRQVVRVEPPIASGLAVGVSQPDAESEAQQLVDAFNATGMVAGRIVTPVGRPSNERLTLLIGPKPTQ